MSVNVSNRKPSTVEFDNNYFKLLDDAVNLINCSFGVKKENKEKYKGFIGIMSDRVMKCVFDMGTYIRIANSIYPVCKTEFESRRIAQSRAIGLCFDLLTKYQNAMRILKVADDKYVNEIKNIEHEINSLKKWRKTDFKRFGKLND